MKKLYLASSSESRKELLKKIGIKFELVETDYKEDMSLELEPMELARLLSRGKAEAVNMENLKKGVILAADTFAVLRGELLGKPKNKKEAKQMLVKICGEIVDSITGYTLIDIESGEKVSKAMLTKVHFKKYDDECIEKYIATAEPLAKAGGFGIQGKGALLIEKIEGDFNSIVGLPISMISDDLRRMGVELI